MKKNVIYLLIIWVFAGALTSCSSDGNEEYIPTPPKVSIENLSGKASCLPGEVIQLKAKLESPLETVFYWSLNGEKVSADSVYPFSSVKTGIYKIVLTATNADGMHMDTLSIDVHDKTVVSIENINGFLAVPQDGFLPLKAHITTPIESTFWWSVGGKKMSTDSVYNFTQQEMGSAQVILNVSNVDGTVADTIFVEVYDKKEFRFTSIRNWTGQGENLSALAIQWVTGDNLLAPADSEVAFLAWGYRWKQDEEPTGDDMLRAVAKNDPRLYLILAEQWGSVTIKGFGYDADNDGKIGVKNETLSLTQDDFTDGIYWQQEGQDIDDLKPVDKDDYWMGGWMKAYASYWLGDGNVIPATEDFGYAQVAAGGRNLADASWDAWTVSPIDYSSMDNTLPISRLIQAAEPNAKK